MAESNLKEMIVDDQDPIMNQVEDEIPYYMLDAQGPVMQVWDFVITLLLIYNFIAVPLLLTFRDYYEY